MTTKDIEEIAVGKVNDELRNYIGLFDSHISQNDKTAFWDGEIWIYNDKNKKKKDYEGRISVQVKGKTVKKIAKGKSKYQIDVDFLNGFKKDKRGTLLFVVEMVIENEQVKEYQIYYCNLLPVDLDQIFKKIKENQKTVSIDISPVKEKSSSSIRNVCINFKNNSDRQFNIKIMDLEEIKDIEQINTYADCEPEYFDDFIVSDCAYTYVTTKNNEKIALPKAEYMVTSCEVKHSVQVEGVEYYDKVTIVTTPEGKSMLIGKSTQIYEGTGRVNIKLNGNIYERAKDIDFLRHFIDIGKLSIDGKESEYSIDEVKKNNFIEQLEKNSVIINKAIKVFDYFNVNFDIDFSLLSEKDIRNIDLLANAMEGNISDKVEPNKMYYTKINKYKILMLMLKRNNENTVMLNFFSDEVKDILFTKYNGKPISIYMNLREQDFIELSNLDINAIKRTFNVICNKKEIIEQVNLYSLEILKAYDKSNNIELLNLAEYINNKLLELSNEPYIRLNCYQIKYRKNSLTESDIDDLYNLRDSEKDEMIQFGVAILLENKRDCKRFCTMLGDDKLDDIKKYPIWTLYEQLCN